MVALKKAIEEEAEAGQGVSDGSAKSTYTLRPEDAVRTVHIFLLFIYIQAGFKEENQDVAYLSNSIVIGSKNIISLSPHLAIVGWWAWNSRQRMSLRFIILCQQYF